VIYFPRRGFDLWNTRYIIVAYAANGWRDPPRAHASFLFQSRQIYPDPERFQGSLGAENVKNWVEARDFKVIKNLVAYPRSWVVHSGRAARPVANSYSDPEADTMREILYAADPLWNHGTDRVYDPHVVAWLSRADLAEVRPYLSGSPPGQSEQVTVTYPNPQQVVLEVDLESPGLVILGDVFYRGWELTIDGTPRPVYRVNGSMRGAAVSAGHHRLVYTFRPPVVRIGGLVSIAGLVALVVLCWACVRSPVDPLLAGDGPLGSETKNMTL
jgi:Bacterial membrane protein YfhO